MSKGKQYKLEFKAQVAQADTPRPLNISSEGKPGYLAEAPVAMIRLSAVYAPASPCWLPQMDLKKRSMPIGDRPRTMLFSASVRARRKIALS